MPHPPVRARPSSAGGIQRTRPLSAGRETQAGRELSLSGK